MKLGGWFSKLGGKAGSQGPSAAPPMLGSPKRFPYGPFQFKIGLSCGGAYEIRASSDLQNWTTIASGNVSKASFERPLSFEHLDPDAPTLGHRFYRVFAGGTPSANVIGYASISLPPGFSMVANPLNAPDNSIAALFATWPDGTTLNKFDTGTFRLTGNGINNKSWANPHDQFVPGEGAICFNPTPEHRPLTFVGEVMQGHPSIPIAAGFSIRSSPVPQNGLLQEELGFPIADGDVIHLFDREKKKYLLHPYENGKWINGSPSVTIGESFWVAKKTPGNWAHDFTIGS